MDPAKEFTFPEYYDFPPFFTLLISFAQWIDGILTCSCCRLQPVRATREKQLGLWKQLILDYHQARHLSIFSPQTSPLFANCKISREWCRNVRFRFNIHWIIFLHGNWNANRKNESRRSNCHHRVLDSMWKCHLGGCQWNALSSDMEETCRMGCRALWFCKEFVCLIYVRVLSYLPRSKVEGC